MGSQEVVRVVLADDHTMVRQALAQILEETSERIQVVGQASNGVEAVQLAEQERLRAA